MVKSELVKRSPLRILEKSIHGGVGKGNIAVLASRKGVGKTACLVHIATDRLLRGGHVIHVSFAARVDHIVSWYEDIFEEIAKWKDVQSVADIHDETVKNRVIMNFNQDGLGIDKVLKSLGAMIGEGHFPADMVIFDGFNLQGRGELAAIKDFARATDVEVWFSASLKGEDPLFDERCIPVEFNDLVASIDVLVTLQFEGDHVRLQLAKDHDARNTAGLHLSLDPRTLLISQDGR